MAKLRVRPFHYLLLVYSTYYPAPSLLYVLYCTPPLCSSKQESRIAFTGVRAIEAIFKRDF
jgi:hypothetical protein